MTEEKRILLCPSMMCADIGDLKQELNELESSGVDVFHLDIMDGHYVPNLGLGYQEVEYIVANTKQMTDAHLMVTNPGEYIEKLVNIGVDIIYIHPETDFHPIRLLNKIKELGAKPGIAISPNVSLLEISELLPYVEYVLLMTVSPGFAGQSFLNSINRKIQDILEVKKQYEFKIVLDGALDPDTIANNKLLGVDGYVLGTSALFGKEKEYKEIIESLRN
ncbi:ribulose-phosphate 3-epimerase [Mollicutes bacterium LVI A0078]|nr:ribulose-phosphate 3-epimerase [Mollicutes bacterium LVI A0075]WOO90211.1 ribulose-phosphate 3-epimerase [Mollicutes bacterium LVI A0078]